MLRFSRNCPKCGRRMERVKRTPFQRLVSRVIPVIHVDCCGHSHTMISTVETRKEKPISGRIKVNKIASI